MSRLLRALCTCAALVAAPAPASAQHAAFVDAFTDLRAAIEGTFGDEGPQIEAALDRMAGGLAEWDRTIQAFESRARSESLPPAEALEMRVALARMYAARGRLSDAQRELDAVTRLDPQRADVHLLRGLVLEASGQANDAADAFRAAWRVDAGSPVAAYYVFHHAARIGDATSAQRARETLAATYRRRLGGGDEATPVRFPRLGLLQDLLGEAPVLPSHAYAAGYALMARGEYDEAIAAFRDAAASDPLVTDPAARSADVRQAIAALRQGRLPDARARLESSDVAGGSSEAHRVLGLIHWAASEYDLSIEQLTAALAERPDDERSRLTLARVLSAAGRHAEAERALLEARERFPDSALVAWWLGLAFDRLNKFAEARRAIEEAAAGAIGGHGQLYASIGRLAGSAADFPAASEAFARAVSANPNDAAMHAYLAGALQPIDRTDEAFVELVAALLIDPRDADAHAGIGRIHLNAGRHDDAAEALRRAVDVSPAHVEARYALATALMRLGQEEEAERAFARVEQAQRQRLAEQRRRIAVDVLKEEAALRAAEGRHDRAAELWRQVVAQEPGRAANQLGLAAALAEAGQLDAAITHYERAVTLGADPGVYRDLAELYARVGRPLEAARARTMYEQAVREDRTRAR